MIDAPQGMAKREYEDWLKNNAEVAAEIDLKIRRKLAKYCPEEYDEPEADASKPTPSPAPAPVPKPEPKKEEKIKPVPVPEPKPEPKTDEIIEEAIENWPALQDDIKEALNGKLILHNKDKFVQFK